MIAQAAETMGEKDVKQTGKWYLSADGPKLGSYWSNISGPLGAEQQSQIDAILQKTYADYVQLLEEHIVAERKGDGVTFTIDAFPRQLDDLTNRFWSEVDPLLSRDQQGVMRYNFPLRFDRRRSMYSSNDIQETLFLFGGERATITIERTGQWFRWSISGPTTGWSSTTPELPRVLSGWERRLDRVLDGVSEGTPTPFRNIPVTAVRPVEL